MHAKASPTAPKAPIQAEHKNAIVYDWTVGPPILYLAPVFVHNCSQTPECFVGPSLPPLMWSEFAGPYSLTSKGERKI